MTCKIMQSTFDDDEIASGGAVFDTIHGCVRYCMQMYTKFEHLEEEPYYCIRLGHGTALNIVVDHEPLFEIEP